MTMRVNEVDGAPSKRAAQGASHDPDADQELIERVRQGDDGAFRALFDRHHHRAYAVAVGVVKNKQDALDIVQDAFIKVHRNLDRFQGSSSFYTWLYRIVMNLCIDHIRRSKRGRSLDFDDAVGRDSKEVAGDGALLPQILGANPRKSVLRAELREAIEKALAELPEYHRAVILLREMEGLSYEEISEILEVPKGTIMSRLFHARRKMQAALSEYLHDDLTLGD